MECATAAALTRTVDSAGSAQWGTRHQGAKLVSGRNLKGIEKQDKELTKIKWCLVWRVGVAIGSRGKAKFQKQTKNQLLAVI